MPTESEREAFLLADLPPRVLKRLPIHVRSDGTVGSADGVFMEDADTWPIPATLREYVTTVRLCPEH